MKNIEFSDDQLSADLLMLNTGFKVTHTLNSSSLFDLDRLTTLAKSLSKQQVEYSSSDVSLNQDPDKIPQTELNIEETIKQIKNCQSWMVLKNVESDPDYKAVLDQCLDEIYANLVDDKVHLSQREAFIFISSPNSTTPYHFDPEHNFLLQIHGKKSFALFPSDNREVIKEESLEGRYYRPETHRNVYYDEKFLQQGELIEMDPGCGVYVPVNAPHWVKTHDDISISFSITFRSEYSDKVLSLYMLNGILRNRFGLKPRAVGMSPLRDNLLYGSYRFARLLINKLRPIKKF